MNPSIFSWFTPAICEFLEKWGWFTVVYYCFTGVPFFFLESYDMPGCHRHFAHFLRDYWWASSFLVNLSLNHTVLRIPGGFYGVHIHFAVDYPQLLVTVPLLRSHELLMTSFFSFCWTRSDVYLLSTSFYSLLLRYIVLARFCNDISQLILWIYLRKGHRYELRPAIPAKSDAQKWKTTVWFITRKLLSSTQGIEIISPNSFCGFVFTRAIDMDLDPPILQNPWTTMKKAYQPKGVGCQKALIKTYGTIFKTIWNIMKYCKKLAYGAFPDNYIKTKP